MIVNKQNENPKKASDKGFTLIEVAFALIMLSASLTVIISLQTSVVTKALRDRNQQQAMLVARSIMSAIEVDIASIVEGFDGFQGNARELLAKLLPQNDEEPLEIDTFEEFDVDLITEVVFIPIPGKLDQIAMKKIDLLLRWGDGPDNQLSTRYFIPTSIEGADTDDAATPETGAGTSTGGQPNGNVTQ